jgi:hypothetical protein
MEVTFWNLFIGPEEVHRCSDRDSNPTSPIATRLVLALALTSASVTSTSVIYMGFLERGVYIVYL